MIKNISDSNNDTSLDILLDFKNIVRTGDKGTLFKPVSSFNNKLVVAEEVMTWTLIYSISKISCSFTD